MIVKCEGCGKELSINSISSHKISCVCQHMSQYGILMDWGESTECEIMFCENCQAVRVSTTIWLVH